MHVGEGSVQGDAVTGDGSDGSLFSLVMIKICGSDDYLFTHFPVNAILYSNSRGAYIRCG
jgi:hypothetical protein